MNSETWNDLLASVASDYEGFVPVSAAVAEGIDRAWLIRLEQAGRLEREFHGVYRVPAWITSERTKFVRAGLWLGQDGVIAGESALEYWQLADVNPREIQVRRFTGSRTRRHPPPAVNFLSPLKLRSLKADIHRDGRIPVLAPIDALFDAHRMNVSRRQLLLATETAHSKGFVQTSEVEQLLDALS